MESKELLTKEQIDDIEENVRSGIVELLILDLLSRGEMYGYQIRQELAKRTNQAFLIKEGSLYGPLYRMSARKLISGHRVLVGSKRVRHYYRIEDSGRAYLAYGKEQMSLVFAGVNTLLNWQEDAVLEDENDESDN